MTRQTEMETILWSVIKRGDDGERRRRRRRSCGRTDGKNGQGGFSWVMWGDNTGMQRNHSVLIR